MAQSKKIFVSGGSVLLCALVALLLVDVFPHENPPEEVILGRGVVVESVREGSAFARAGLLPGDVLRAWERLPNPPANAEGASGPIESIFDWMWVEEEQGPRGEIRLIGERDAEVREFHVPLGFGYARVRPRFSEPVLADYLRGLELLEADHNREGNRVWERAAEKARLVPDDRAWLLLETGAVCRDQTREWDKALEMYQAALAGTSHPTAQIVAWKGLGETHWVRGSAMEARGALEAALNRLDVTAPESLARASVLADLGNLAWKQDKIERSLFFDREALELRRRLAPGSPEVVRSLINIATSNWRQGELSEAADYLDRALIAQRELDPGSLREASILNNLGAIAKGRSDLAAAETYYLEALRLRQKWDPEGLSVAGAWSNLGVVAFQQGQFEAAIERHRKALEIRQTKVPGTRDLAQTLVNLGAVFHASGDLIKAEHHYERAREIQEAVAPNSADLASVLMNLGMLARNRSALRRAGDLLSSALKIRSLGPDSLYSATMENELGELFFVQGELEAASLAHERALHIQERLAPGGLQVAESLDNLGRVALARGDRGGARDHLQRALEIRKALAPNSLQTSLSWRHLGDLAVAEADLGLALERYQQALSIQKHLAPGSSEEATTLYNIARVHWSEGSYELARESFLASLQALDDQMRRLGGSHSQRVAFRRHFEPYYKGALALLLDLGESRVALHILERWRAQNFLAQLSERDLLFLMDVPAELVAKRRRLAALYDQTQRELAVTNSAEPSAEAETPLQRLERIRDELDQVAVEIREASPELSVLRYPDPLELAGIQETLDRGTVLLSFSVGEERTNLFAITRDDGLKVVTVPVGEEQLQRQVQDFRGLIARAAPGHTAGAQRSLRVLAMSLYELLIEPVEEIVARGERILFVADGPLHLLPWATLIRKHGDGARKDRDWQYLIEWKPLHSVLSATVYAELTRGRSFRSPESRPLQLVAFGNPNYPNRTASPGESSTRELRSIVERGFFDWSPLPYSGHEVESIAKLFSPHEVKTLLGYEATEEAAKAVGRDPADSPRILHFATHGYLDERLPFNSGLIFSIPEEFQEGQDNGVLQVWEILEGVRLDADLVVLSACASALGQDQGGEGLMGLTRAFQYAGARSVVASLWNVRDRSTAELMSRFYKHLQRGLPKAQALQAAQVEMIRQPVDGRDRSGSYNWAGFQVYGDWQ